MRPGGRCPPGLTCWPGCRAWTWRASTSSCYSLSSCTQLDTGAQTCFVLLFWKPVTLAKSPASPVTSRVRGLCERPCLCGWLGSHCGPGDPEDLPGAPGQGGRGPAHALDGQWGRGIPPGGQGRSPLCQNSTSYSVSAGSLTLASHRWLAGQDIFGNFSGLHQVPNLDLAILA